jgi:hypothetical protein
MSSEVISIIDRQLDAYNRADLEDFIACYTPDVRLFRLHTHEQFACGHADMRTIYSQRFASPGLHAIIAQRMVLGDFVIDYEQISGFPGKETTITEAIAIYHVTQGLIDKAWFIRKEEPNG